VLGLGQEVGHLAGVDAGLALDAGLQEFLATGLEGAVQLGDELEGLEGEDGFVARLEGALICMPWGRLRLMEAPLGEG
jgi:hypothetical protein